MNTPNPEQPIDAFIYTRISEDRAGAGLGVDRQREDGEALAQRLGWHIRGVFSDNDISAMGKKERPDYKRMVAAFRARAATGLVIWHTDRLHRTPSELEEFITLADEFGIVTHSVQSGPIDLSTPTGRMHARIACAVARHESEHKAQRIKRARLQTAMAGGWSGGIRPFGFEPDGVTIRPSEAAAILRATEQLLAGVSLRGVTRGLNENFTTSLGNPWGTVETRDMIERARNAGLSIYQGQVIGKASWEPIVSKDAWLAVCALLSDPVRRTTPGNQPRWLGSHLYQCGRCDDGGVIVTSTSGGRHRHPSYRCRDRVHISRNAVEVDKLVTKALLKRLARKDAIELLAPPAENHDMSALYTEATTLRARLDGLAVQFAEGGIDAAQLRAGTERLRFKLKSAEDQIAAAALVDPLSGIVRADDVPAYWEGLELGQQRKILSAVMTVTLVAGRKGRMPDGSYFDPESVVMDFRKPLRS